METTIEIKPINTNEAKEGEQQAQLILTDAKNLQILDQKQYDFAGDLLKKIKAKADDLEMRRKEITKPLDIAKKSVMDLFRKPLDLLEQAEGILKKGMLSFFEEQERKRRVEEERLRKEAEEKERREKEKLENKAKKAEQNGNAEKAEQLRQQAETVSVTAPVLAPTVETPKGISYRDDWYAEVVDLPALCKAIVDGKASISFIEANMTALNKQAKSTKDNWKVDGVAFKSRKIVSSTTARC